MNTAKKIIILLIIVCSCQPAFSQNNIDFFTDTTQSLSFSLGANYSYGSTTMNNDFLNKFIFGGKIERSDKDRVYKNLSSINRLGGDLNYEFKVEIPIDTFFKKTNISLVVGLENAEHVDARFTSDLFKFTFDGNKQFAGEAIDIGGTSFNYYKLQKLNLGLVNYRYFNGQLAKEGITLSVIKAQESKSVKIADGSIFTEEFGREIDVELDYLYLESDTANRGLSAFNGLGLSVDLFTEFILKNGDKIYLGIEDLGFVHWNDNSLEIAADSVFHYEGVTVDNIFDLNDSLVSGLTRDSIINNLSTKNEKNGYGMAMPASVNINYTKVINDNWKINVGIYQKILSNYYPLISVNGYYYFNPKFVGRAHLSYGGYGKLNTGLAFSKSVKKYFDIFIGTNNIEAYIVAGSSYSSSGFVGLKAYF
ncbi:DUF5723 family protein [Vicingaceae bacterium]|nr:DUF5723 family protein [Vicingaceae bacterium]